MSGLPDSPQSGIDRAGQPGRVRGPGSPSLGPFFNARGSE